ncbi:collectin-11 [Plakobranchus ocellatus]|uniref:Collectin-11 n=1 Tax=Plakobranchus ocellatus TaxID=259542 RepID=A0AAV3Y5N1_9GAST|nr:collectin-11 [Plakobranchus ocellatus]
MKIIGKDAKGRCSRKAWQTKSPLVLYKIYPRAEGDKLSVMCLFDKKIAGYNGVEKLTLGRRAQGTYGNYTEIGTITAEGALVQCRNLIARSKCSDTPTSAATQSCATFKAVARLQQKKDQCFAQLADFTKLLSIDGSKYFISNLYKGRLYTMSKKIEPFGLEKMNSRCKELGGYLVEHDNEEEQDFVAKFSNHAGRNLVYMGANDIEKEGTFVQYNSKKVMSNVRWNTGEPNNTGGDEDCAVTGAYGLIDVGCSRTLRYICEIPLV